MPRFTNRQIADALTATCGHLYLAAEKLGCRAGTIRDRIRRNPRLAAIVESCRGRMVDTAEAALHRAILEGESWAVRLTLTTLGRDRGYGDSDDTGKPGQSFLAQEGFVKVSQVLAQVFENKDFLDYARAKRIAAVPPGGIDGTALESKPPTDSSA